MQMRFRKKSKIKRITYLTKNSHYVILLYDILNLQYHVDADVVELADTQDLGSCARWRAGSSPVIRTKNPL